MAMVLDAFASYVGDLLKQAAEEELGMMLGVSGDIDKMGVKLGDLKNLLADAERRRITDDSVQQWVTELKRAMYEATDILDLCQLKIMERGSSAPDMGCCNPLLFCLRNPHFAHEIGGRMKKLNQTLDSIKDRSAAFSFLSLSSYEDRRLARPNAAYRKTNPVLEQSGVVGDKIEDDTRSLVEKLTNKNDTDDIMVVTIVGVTTGKRCYPDGQNYAYDCRRPTTSYADSLGLAVGLSWPSGYTDLRRRQPSAQNGRRPRCRHADSSRRHKPTVGIPVGPATPPVTSG
ncbi:hypothetical protein ACQJBY_031037 [Aegilops geniculata]